MAAARAQRYAATFAALTVFAILTMTLGFACSSSTKPAAGLEVIISTNMQAPQDFDNLEVKVSQTTMGVPGAALFDTTDAVPNAVTLPTSVSIAAGHSSDQGARIVVRALKGSMVIVERTAQVQIPTDSLLELQLFLSADCANVSCGALTTCITGGRCQTIAIAPSQLQPYQPGDLGSSGGGGNGSSGAGDATVGGVDSGAGPCPDTMKSMCAATGGCLTATGTTCSCVGPGGACPTGGTCNAGVCGGSIGFDSGTGSCSATGQQTCMGPGGCYVNSGGTCTCVTPGSPCPTGGTCNAGTCGTLPPDAGTGMCGPAARQACMTMGYCFSNVGGTCGCVPQGTPCPGGGTCSAGGGCAASTGCTPGTPCSAGGQTGTCDSTGICVPMACGQSGQSCCGSSPPGNCNGTNLFCNSSFTCVACGGVNQPCCGGSYCPGTGLQCNGSICVPQCGLAGNACCPYNQCNSGCCENGICTGQGSTCSLYGGTCASQGCQGDTCGANGQACCNGPSGPGCTNGYTVCRSGTCQACGMPGAVGSNCCPGDVCMNGPWVCSHAADAGSGGIPDAGYCVNCGGYHQVCCNGDGGVGPMNQTPCQTGYTCTSGTCQ